MKRRIILQTSPLTSGNLSKPPTFFSKANTAAITDTITKLCEQKRLQEAINVLHISISARPPPSLYSSLLNLCVALRAPDEARRILAIARISGAATELFVSNRLIALYANCGRLSDARKVFDEMPQRDPCSWNTLIAGYSNANNLVEARRLFDDMPGKDHFSWSTMMSAYGRRGWPLEALKLYREKQCFMSNRVLTCSDKFTASAALAACAAIPCSRQGKEIHAHIMRVSLESDIVILSALSDMYAKCGRIDNARFVFDATVEKDIVSWTGMIGRYFDGGWREEGFELFSDMLMSRVRPTEFTFATVLDACSKPAAEDFGKQVHGNMMRMGIESSPFAASALVHMYSKCGSIEKASIVFRAMQKPDLVSWTSMISGYAQNGHPEESLRYFELLLQSGMKPDHVTFVGVLSACTHAGLVEKGLEVFHSIKDKFGLTYTGDHYACVVDLLSRSGRFLEVEEIISSMQMKPNKFLWASLLGGCRIYGNLKLAKMAAEALFEIEPENAATYVTLANVYASNNMWEEVEQIRQRMEDKQIAKNPGSSWIEIKRQIHVFLVGDKSHPRTKEIYLLLKKLLSRMREEGYVPDTNYVLHDVEDEQKEQDLAHHSEKLAVAFGIIAAPLGAPVKVFKNLRICGDCHTAIKFISRIVEREIIVRDSNRFHRFKDGACSCRDYW
ncbi:hypothetical protein J5N97_005901 [Dioscorea zingiberensis]|uniref:DYW domain-containing protein n=1 Tax=Dioscorea zingiberensis TaxID=325984 RepID=A0A9D5D8Z9_9LILI|nr:hypothetical protein J5N97_005901 [Dioscorea zingiberensis]